MHANVFGASKPKGTYNEGEIQTKVGGRTPDSMTICSCGNEEAETGTLCARCAALKELELEPGATNEEIKEAFHALAKAWRPNLFPQQLKAQVEEKREAIDAAYSLLLGSMERPQPTPGAEGELPLKQQGKEQELAEIADSSTEPAPRSGAKWHGMLPQRVWTVPMPIALGCGLIVSALVTGWLLLGPLDAALESNPATARVVDECNASVRSGVAQLKNRIRDEAGLIVHFGSSRAPVAAPPPVQQTEQTEPAVPKPARRKTAETHPDVRDVLPYITAGLSKSEVISVQGKPAEETENMLVYGKSEFYFRNDQLVGWKIDPASPVRVKLWPDASVDPDLDSFGVGSTKNEVIVVEGTPTFFSENTFGYRGSEVYFKNNRVVGWKNDPWRPLRTGDQ